MNDYRNWIRGRARTGLVALLLLGAAVAMVLAGAAMAGPVEDLAAANADERGQDVMPSAEQAYVWYTLAAFRFMNGDAQARDRVMQSRERVAAKMTPEQLAGAQKMAREWRPN